MWRWPLFRFFGFSNESSQLLFLCRKTICFGGLRWHIQAHALSCASQPVSSTQKKKTRNGEKQNKKQQHSLAAQIQTTQRIAEKHPWSASKRGSEKKYVQFSPFYVCGMEESASARAFCVWEKKEKEKKRKPTSKQLYVMICFVNNTLLSNNGTNTQQFP